MILQRVTSRLDLELAGELCKFDFRNLPDCPACLKWSRPIYEGQEC